jgi:hypothetical protein
LHELRGTFRRVWPPSRASLPIPSRNRLTDRDSSHGLSLPTAHAESKVHLRKAYLPIAFRPQGLTTLSAVSSLRNLAGFVSHRQHSWDSPFGAFSSRKASGGFPPEEPTYRWLRPKKRPKADRDELADSVSGLCSFQESLAKAPCLAGPSLDAPLGFTLPGSTGTNLVQGFARTPLTCFSA